MRNLGFVFLICSLLLSVSACDNKDHHIDSLIPIVDSRGAFVLCGGIEGDDSSTPGALAYIEFDDESVQRDVFQKRNGRQLGTHVTGGLVYGEKLYIAVSSDSLIEVVNRRTWESVRQIKLNSDILSQAPSVTVKKSTLPLAVSDGLLYVGCDSNIVAIDTLNFTLKHTYALKATVAGDSVKLSSPVAIAVAKGTLFACFDGSADHTQSALMIIDLSDTPSPTTCHTTPGIIRPTALAVAWPQLFVLDQGNATTPPSVRRLSARTEAYKGQTMTVNTIIKTNQAPLYMNVAGTKLYTCTASPATCSVYDLQSALQSTFTSDIASTPCLVAADPVTGHVFVASRPASSQNADGNAVNAVLAEYNAQGKKVNTYDIPANPIAVVFDVGTRYVEY